VVASPHPLGLLLTLNSNKVNIMPVSDVLTLNPYQMPLKLFTQIGLFPQHDIQVTSGTPKQARSESIIAVNPLDRNNLIAASKKFSNPQTYRFTIGVRVSFDGGGSWQDATLPTLPDWPAMAGKGGEDAPGDDRSGGGLR
jgi:hypothetical protein